MRYVGQILGVAGAVMAAGCDAPLFNTPAYYEGAERLVINNDVLNAAQGDEGDGHPVLGAFVQSEYWLDYRAPTELELEMLQPPGSTPDEMIPWIQRDDIDVSVQWTLTNETDQEIDAWVTLDGATEFFDYNPIASFGLGGGEDAEEPVFPSLLGFTPRHLEPNQVLRGEFREDDITELMFDLDVMTRFCGGPFALIYNRSEQDDVGTEMVPSDAVIGGVAMLRITVAANARVSLEYALRVRDRGGALFDSRQDNTRYEVEPMLFAPAAAGGDDGMMMDPDAEPMGCMLGGG